MHNRSFFTNIFFNDKINLKLEHIYLQLGTFPLGIHEFMKVEKNQSDHMHKSHFDIKEF